MSLMNMEIVCISDNIVTKNFFNEVYRIISKYKSKHIKGDFFKYCFADKNKTHIFTMDTKDNNSFYFKGKLRRGVIRVNAEQELDYCILRYGVSGTSKLFPTVYSSEQEAFQAEIKPIFDVVVSILEFVSEITGEDWKTHVYITTEARYKQYRKITFPSSICVNSSNTKSSFPFIRKNPKITKRLSLEISENHPLYKKMRKLFSENCTGFVSEQTIFIDKTFKDNTKWKLLTYEVQETDILRLCAFLKVKSFEELSTFGDSIQKDPFTDMFFSISQTNQVTYDGVVDKNCIKTINKR